MKKVLVISYYWPPAGGGGVQRWLKFTKYLPLNNIQPVIVIPDGPDYPVLDLSLKEDIPDNITTIKIPIWEPYKLFKLFSRKKKEENVNSGLLGKSKKKSLVEKVSLWVRGNFLIPDPRVFWVRPTVKKIHQYLKESDIDIIITTGPPHSIHLIGLKLKRKTGIKWIADFRDPWSEIDYLEIFKPSALAMKIQQGLEKKVLTSADKIVTVSENWSSDLKRLGAKDVAVITNGFDSDDFKDFNFNLKRNKFILLYSGILHEYRNPEFLWDELEQLCRTDAAFALKFELRLFGTIDDKVIDYLESLPYVGKRFYYGGYISHHQLLEQYEKASLLLLLQNNTENALGHIPGKVFEYMATRIPVLGIGNPDSDVARILNEVNAGVLYEPSQLNNIREYILKVENIKDFPKSDSFNKYSREKLTQNLVKILHDLK